PGGCQIVIWDRLAGISAGRKKQLGRSCSTRTYSPDEAATIVGAELSKIAGPRTCRQNLSACVARIYQTLPLIVGEEKQLILDDRAAYRAAELVVTKLRLVLDALRVE